MALLLLYKMYIYECGWNAHSDERKNHLTFIWVRARETSIRNILMEKSSKAMRQDNAHCTTYLYLYVGAIVVARIMHFLCANMMLDFVQLLFVYACMRGGNDVDVEALNFIYFTYIYSNALPYKIARSTLGNRFPRALNTFSSCRSMRWFILHSIFDGRRRELRCALKSETRAGDRQAQILYFVLLNLCKKYDGLIYINSFAKFKYIIM